MAEVPIKSASNGLYPHSYNPITVASLDYGELLCSRFIESEKSDKWKKVKANGSLRLAALDFPAYGRAYIKSAAFFVPTYQLLQNADGLRSNMLVDKGQSCVMPHVKSDFLAHLLDARTYTSLVWSGTDLTTFPTNYDSFDFINVVLAADNVSTQWQCLKLTAQGRRLYKFYKMLGYDFPSYNDNTTFANQPVPINVNALNILAYLKVYTDYFLNIHLFNSSWMVAFLRAVKDGHDFSFQGVPFYTASTGEITEACLRNIFLYCRVPFESNLYTNAWNDPNSPTGILNSQQVSPKNLLSPYPFPNIVTYSNNSQDYPDEVLNLLSGTVLNLKRDITSPSPGFPNCGINYLSQNGLNSLYAVFEFIRRNNLFGSEAARQALARFGIKGNDYNTYFVSKLFEDSQQIDFSAVMSNSNTLSGGTGSRLGAYAGVGLGSMNFDYNYQCSDYGIILNLNWIQFNTLQFHGFDPSVLRYHAFDFYTPEWDGKAQRAVPMMELGHARKPLDASYNNNDVNVFGFIGLYDDYRTMRDVVLGDFVCGFAKNYLFGRDISKIRDYATSHIVPQSDRVQYFNQGGGDYTLADPFQFDYTNGDRFYLQFIWEIDSDRPMLSYSDSLMLNGTGDIKESTDSTNMA